MLPQQFVILLYFFILLNAIDPFYQALNEFIQARVNLSLNRTYSYRFR